MKTNNSDRRSFLQKASLGTLAALTMPQAIVSSFASENAKAKKITLKSDDIILFQGDSITDAGRVRTETAFNNQKALGGGYSFLAAASLLNNHPGKRLKIYNKGISGNKVYQLAERWDADALDLKPNVLSILIGVNDYWHFRNKKYDGTIETYKNDYKALIERTLKALPDVKLIIGEPFSIIGKSVDASWAPALKPYQEAAKNIADTFGAAFIPYQKVFDNALKLAPGEFWAPDGVHPSIAGAQLMADAWQEAISG